MKCRICGSEKIEKQLKVKEMMIPTREEFGYFKCAECHCLQLEEVPDNLGDYYGEGYYSYQETDVMPMQNPITDMSPILDVGCGAGKFLKQLREAGYGNLQGCDPFLPNDIAYGEDIHIWRKSIHEMDGSFDRIFMNDSFEHVTDPHEVMDSLYRLIQNDGIIRIAIPVYPNIAVDMFEENWYQLDAPRHIFLHSVESMNYLASAHGMKVIKVEYDSNASQIYRSYLYAKNIPFWEQKMSMLQEEFPEEEFNEIESLTKEANDKGYGDHAIFYLIKMG